MEPAHPLYSIRAATPADANELSTLVNSAYRGDSSRAGWTTEADILGGQRTDPSRLREEIEAEGCRILCLRESENGPILGCVFLELFAEGGRRGAYLGMLTVKPDIQARGLGKTLMNAAEEASRQWGAEAIHLGVIQVRTSLMEWYERRGYKKTGLTKPFPYGDLQFGSPRRDDLYFVIFEKRLNP
jgi:GNAT superfamily N-acetyltransferase